MSSYIIAGSADNSETAKVKFTINNFLKIKKKSVNI